MAVVMPDGGRGWYTNAVEGDAYEDDLLKDVLGLVERTFPARRSRAGRAIGGLSMGGYGAAALGLKHPRAARQKATLPGPPSGSAVATSGNARGLPLN